MKWRWLAGLAALAFVGSAVAQTKDEPRTPAPQEPPVWQRLERFSGDAEFLRYVRDVQRLSQRGRVYHELDAVGAGVVPPPAPPPPPPPPPPLAMVAPSPNAQEAVAVIGSRVSTDSDSASEPSSITNVQTQGVDEGGIVKQIGRYLIVLQDGRLFVVNTRTNDEARLSLVGRTNVYRAANADTWYDEVLVSGNRVLVTGYSYRERASEVTIFSINDSGELQRETTYYITSNDYYDIENYATRLVNGNLVIYTPLQLSNINPDARMVWPVVRRWLRDGERQAVTTQGRALFDADDIYKPVQRSRSPMVHSVSVCPLGDVSSGDELDCRTTAFVGQTQREFFVSTTDIFLWVTPTWQDGVFEAGCERGGDQPLPATIFQVPLNGSQPRALHARGQPITQLALDATPDEFRALVSWNTGPCNSGGAAQTRYFHAPLSTFNSAPRNAPATAFVETPSPGTSQYEVRFTDTHVVYGGRDGWGSYPPTDGSVLSAQAVAVPLARPRTATVIDTPHNIIRVERVGDDAVLTGYRSEAGLSVSLVDLGARPRIADTRVLRNRYESEGRSHAFNALVGPSGDGVMGLPTVTRVKEGGRWWFRSQASDVSFLSVNASGQLGGLGELLANPNAQDPGYRCEVSCVDWYGNTRALYIGNRVFALSGTELIEGAVESGRIVERTRLNLSQPLPRASANVER